MKNKVPRFVYRFIPIHRLLNIIGKNEITFSRNTRWTDPLEGYLVKKYVELENKDPYHSSRQQQYSNYVDLRFFLCCTKSREKDFQWKYYTPDKDGVRIKISTLDLFEHVKKNHDIIVKPIKYLELKKFNQELTRFRKESSQVVNHLLFYKRGEFIDEKEIRFMIQEGHDDDELLVRIDPLKVVKEILFDPRMPSRSFEIFAEFISKKWPKTKIEHSNLYDPDRSIKYIKN